MSFAFFDLDDTLVDTDSALRAWSLDFVRENGLGEDAAAADVVRRRVHTVTTWREFAEQARAWYGIATEPQQLLAKIAVDYPAKFTLDPAVTAGLGRLRADGWRLGIITNGTTVVQQAKVDRVGLRAHVDVVIDSEAAGHHKPDVRIFELAAGRLGVGLGPAGWMVGDMLDKDVEGGLAAGLHTVWLPHGRPLPADGPQPEHVVGTIADALALIAASAGTAGAAGTAGGA